MTCRHPPPYISNLLLFIQKWLHVPLLLNLIASRSFFTLAATDTLLLKKPSNSRFLLQFLFTEWRCFFVFGFFVVQPRMIHLMYRSLAHYLLPICRRHNHSWLLFLITLRLYLPLPDPHHEIFWLNLRQCQRLQEIQSRQLILVLRCFKCELRYTALSLRSYQWGGGWGYLLSGSCFSYSRLLWRAGFAYLVLLPHQILKNWWALAWEWVYLWIIGTLNCYLGCTLLLATNCFNTGIWVRIILGILVTVLLVIGARHVTGIND